MSSFLLLIALILGCGGKPSPGSSSQDSSAAKPAAGSALNANDKNILFFGDSLTAGYGLDDPSEAFPGVIKEKIDSLKLPYNVINAGVSGETSAGGLARIDWILRTKVDIFMLELGANDGLRGNSVLQTTNNLQAIIDKVKAKYPKAKIILLGMQVPPSMGETYAQDFKKLFPALAAKNHIDFVPFLLEGVGGNPKLNQQDGIHPTAEGAKIVANNVWKVLKRELS
jgi:acyl-CoA thioesterase-1